MALLLKDFVRQRSVGVDTLVNGHAQTSQHDGDQAAGAGATDHVEVVTGLRRGVGVDGGHEPAQDHEGGQAANAAAVEGEQAEVGCGHGRRPYRGQDGDQEAEMEASRCQYRNAGEDCWKESSSMRLKRDGLAALVRIGPKHRLRGLRPCPRIDDLISVWLGVI
jgi:hypothetical protein